MKRVSLLFIVITTLLVWQACTTQKNTMVHRTYHNTTSYYNIFFNGKEAYKKGLKKIETDYQNDYTKVLPVYKFGTLEASQSGTGDMNVAIQKCSKVIKQHSIRVKPKTPKKGKGMTKKERKFFKKTEYNKWIDDSYLLMGKAYMHQMEFSKAVLSLQVVLRKFPSTPSADLANLWLWRTYLEKGDFIQSETFMNHCLKSNHLKKEHGFDLYALEAEYNIRQQKFEPAQKALKQAQLLAPNKAMRYRIQFIIAQTYLKLEDFRKASQLFGIVAQKSSNYDLAFNARIQQAISFDEGAGDYNSLIKDLKSLAKDEKNEEYLDRIYLAMATAASKKGKTNDAVANYRKALEAQGEDTNIKAEAHLALANIYLDQQKYQLSGAYYDSTMINISGNHPDYFDVSIRAKSLINLAKNMEEIQLQDSLQDMARMPEKDRNVIIDAAISHLKEQEAEKARQEEIAKANDTYDNNRQPNNMGQAFGGGGSGWYFYNSSSLSFGTSEFKRKWGSRKLSDHWRRKNKSMSEVANAKVDDQNNQKEAKAAINDPKNREYYLQNLPKSEADFAKSDAILQESLLFIGNAFKNEVKDLQEAVNHYKEVIKRYPDSDFSLEALYNLYLIASENGDSSQANKYKQQIITQFPNSSRAKALSDPSYAARLKNAHKVVSANYTIAFGQYEKGLTDRSMQLIDQTLNEFPKNYLHVKLTLLHAMCQGKALKMEAYKAELKQVIDKFPEDEVIPMAKRMLKVAIKGKVDDVRVVEEIYFHQPATAHLVCIPTTQRKLANQIKFQLAKMQSSQQGASYTVNIMQFGAEFVVVISQFQNAETAEKYRITLADNKELRDKSSREYPYFLIAQKNYKTLLQDLDFPKYIEFYKANYGQ